MKITIAGMKDIRDVEPVPAGHAIDGHEHLRQSRPGNNGIHGDHIGSEAAHRTKGSFAAEPQSSALVIVLRDSHLISRIAETDDFTFSRYGLDREDMIRRHSILQAMGSA